MDDAIPPSKRELAGMSPVIAIESRSQPTILSDEIAPLIRMEASAAIAPRRSIGTRATAVDPFFPSGSFWAPLIAIGTAKTPMANAPLQQRLSSRPTSGRRVIVSVKVSDL